MNRFRKKLLEAIVFFSREVRNPTKMMVYKLLAELDSRHFSEKGYPSTNLEYEAWPLGPVPNEFDKEITQKDNVIIPNDFQDSILCEKFEFEDEKGRVKYGFRFIARRKPDLSVFTPREQRILREVAEIYATATAAEASEASHERDKPWSKTPLGEKIDFLKSVKLPKNVSEEEAREMIREIEAFHKTYH